MNKALYLLLAVVALAAAVLSFDALHGLAVLCGFTPKLAPLLPITVDAGAAAGSLVWLRAEPPAAARRFARVLALVLLGGSVAGNALGHGLAAYAARPAWWVVVLVSAVPPAVLGAVVHLAVLAGRTRPDGSVVVTGLAGDLGMHVVRGERRGTEGQNPTVARASSGIPEDLRDVVETDQAPALIAEAPAPQHRDGVFPVPVPIGGERGNTPEAQPGQDRVAELIAAGLGRVQLQRELGVSEHAAKQLIKAHRNGHRYGGETS